MSLVRMKCETSSLDKIPEVINDQATQKVDHLGLLERWTKLGVEFEVLQRENAELKHQINVTRSRLRVIASTLI